MNRLELAAIRLYKATQADRTRTRKMNSFLCEPMSNPDIDQGDPCWKARHKEIIMPRETPFQRASTMDMQPSIRRMGRPLRSAPLVSQHTEAARSRASIRRWMLAHKEEYRDRRTGELNLTEMVEAWDMVCADGGATLDPDHLAWDVAASLE